MRLLSLPRGALAAIAHVDRAWSHSFAWQEAGAASETAALNGDFHSAIERIAQGLPVGFAMEYFGQRYAELATMLSDELDTLELGGRCDPMALASLWTAHSDARGYIVLGDPAARLVFRDAAGGPRVPDAPDATPQVTSPAPAPDALAVLLADLWQTLERASREPGHPFRIAALCLPGTGFPELHPARLCSVGETGETGDARRVLRLQAKLPGGALCADPRCTVLFMDAARGIELRVRGHAVFDPTGLALTVQSLEQRPLDSFDKVDTVDNLDRPNALCPLRARFTWPDAGGPVRSELLTAP